jgi:exodeoxyribonuclease III
MTSPSTDGPVRRPSARSCSRIISWNVAGLRSVVRSNHWDVIPRFDPEIICLQELRCEKEEVPLSVLNCGYEFTYWSPGRNLWSGVGLLSRTKPESVTFGINGDHCNRVLTADFGTFILINVYCPFSGYGLARVDYRLYFDQKLRNYIRSFTKKSSLIVCGDFNVAHEERDVHRSDRHREIPGFTTEERNSFSALLRTGLTDAFRYLDKRSYKYTFWSFGHQKRLQNKGWRIDYFLLNNVAMETFRDCGMHWKTRGSGHCPIFLLWGPPSAK